MNLLNFWYASCSYGPPWENHTLYAGKILIWQVYDHLRPKFGNFWPNLTALRVFDLQLPYAVINLPNFWYGTSLNFDSFRGTNHTVFCWYGSCSYGHLWENHALYARKILIWRSSGHLIPKFDHFWPKLTVLRVFYL